MPVDVVTGGAAQPIPEKPIPKGGPSQSWNHRKLYDRVLDAIYALPGFFQTSLRIAGVRATDLHTLNTTLGASIEQSVVENLNALRTLWDPDGHYRLYSFVRQAQSWPDVLLQTSAPGQSEKILFGVELKGWFVLSKEGEPSFRFTVSPSVCTDADLLVVFPWCLDEVISGTPRLVKPFVTEARHAAEVRNFYWKHGRDAQGDDAEIIPAPHTSPYPTKKDKFTDKAKKDGGNNFGRVARGGIMEDFIGELMRTPAAGIPLGAWYRFFRIFTEKFDENDVRSRLERIEKAFATELASSSESANSFKALCEAILAFCKSVQRGHG